MKRSVQAAPVRSPLWGKLPRSAAPLLPTRPAAPGPRGTRHIPHFILRRIRYEKILESPGPHRSGRHAHPLPRRRGQGDRLHDREGPVLEVYQKTGADGQKDITLKFLSFGPDEEDGLFTDNPEEAVLFADDDPDAAAIAAEEAAIAEHEAAITTEEEAGEADFDPEL